MCGFLCAQDSWEHRWHAVFDMLGLCPTVPPTQLSHTAVHSHWGVLQQQLRLVQQPVEAIWDLRTEGVQSDASQATLTPVRLTRN